MGDFVGARAEDLADRDPFLVEDAAEDFFRERPIGEPAVACRIADDGHRQFRPRRLGGTKQCLSPDQRRCWCKLQESDIGSGLRRHPDDPFDGDFRRPVIAEFLQKVDLDPDIRSRIESEAEFEADAACLGKQIGDMAVCDDQAVVDDPGRPDIGAVVDEIVDIDAADRHQDIGHRGVVLGKEFAPGLRLGTRAVELDTPIANDVDGRADREDDGLAHTDFVHWRDALVDRRGPDAGFYGRLVAQASLHRLLCLPEPGRPLLALLQQRLDVRLNIRIARLFDLLSNGTHSH